ncbi:MAG: peptidase M22 [Clostridia bacterium]|nr:peptidase M22 [Clostridia bacterium]
MACFLGIDTSNYTTSAAVMVDGEIKKNIKLPVKVADGARGIRQSDAVFSHVKNLPAVIEAVGELHPDAIGYSAYPRDNEGSYMPCFLAGEATARSLASILGIPAYPFSHQAGHVAAAVYSSGKPELYNAPFIAFHVSGGTTDMLLVEAKNRITRIGGTKDLNAGQAVDRTGILLGLDFPCGPALEALCEIKKPIKCGAVSVKGLECNLSGLENKIKDRIAAGHSHAEIAAFLFSYIIKTLDRMTENALEVYGKIPLLFAGGVMSNRIIKDYFSSKYGAHFAEPAFSCDNAAGIAYLCSERFKELS